MAKWVLMTKKADFHAISEKYHIDPVIARIMRNRDIVTDEEINSFLNGTMADLHDPFLMLDMEKAVATILNAIEKEEKIRIIGDYDVDGICSTYILHQGIRILGGNADTYIPDRIMDGYGLSLAMIEACHQEGVHLLITCDNGIAASEAVLKAKEYGIKVVITDHHEVPYLEENGSKKFVIPQADAVVDPKQEDCKYPFSGICGGVVAYKVMQALFITAGKTKQFPEQFIEMAAFATICDVMELKDENRMIVKAGLSAMKQTKLVGLKALFEVCQIAQEKIGSYHIGFICGPCFNATGRLDTAARALELLEEEDFGKAIMIARQLKELNDSRKDMTVEGTAQAEAYLIEKGIIHDPVLVIFLPDVHESIAGIIAGRMKEHYHKPVFVLTKANHGVKGSGRSIPAYHMYEKLNECAYLFTKFGGHKMAAGVSLPEENVEPFREFLVAHANLSEDDLQEKITIDVPMPLSYIRFDLIEQFSMLEPFGVGNPKPVFAQKNVKVLSCQHLGKNGSMGKYMISDGAGTYEMIYFGALSEFEAYYQKNENISIIYYPSINEYGGKKRIQIVMQAYQ